jgi:ABC-type Zn uptake system ZnuABC Zn-binding protein ZnuA
MRRNIVFLVLLICLLASCQPANGPLPSQAPGLPRILAVESFLADIARNIAGDRLDVHSLIPQDADPHTYQLTPADVAKMADADSIIINGANLESFISPVLKNLNEKQLLIVASDGLMPRPDPTGEHPEGDPHFWLDPTKVITYAENLKVGFIKIDPAGEQVYSANAQRYEGELEALDSWIKSQVQEVAPSRRLLITNHETFGYFADRYGFTIVGAILPGITSGAAPSAQELASLIEQIRLTGAPAIFLETGANPQLADQLASETGAKVVSDLYTHSLSPADGPAATYINMIKYDVSVIVKALK